MLALRWTRRKADSAATFEEVGTKARIGFPNASERIGANPTFLPDDESTEEIQATGKPSSKGRLP